MTTKTDERIVEAVFWKADPPLFKDEIATMLAALRDAGFDLYRPDDCLEATVEHGGSYPDPYTGEEREAEPVLRSKQIETTRCILKLGTYHLVPVGGDR